jgi:hypothetical protein
LHLDLSEMPFAIPARLPVRITAALPVIVFAGNPSSIAKSGGGIGLLAIIFSISWTGNRITAAGPW